MATLLDYVGITKLRDAWPKWKANVIAINNQVINHVAGTADKHAAQDITYSGSFTSNADIKAALDQAKTEIDTIVVNASVDPEVALARESSVKAKTFATIDARFEESEQDLVSYEAESATQFNSMELNVLFPPSPLVKVTMTDAVADTTNLQAQIDSGAKKIYLPPGTINLNASLIFTQPIEFIGAGKYFTTLIFADGIDGLDIRSDYVTIRGLKIVSKSSLMLKRGINNNVVGVRSQKITIDDCWLVGWLDGFFGVGTTTSHFTNNITQTCMTGLRFTGQCVNVWINNNLLTCVDYCINCGSDTTGAYPEGFMISDNIIYGSVFGICLLNADFFYISNNIIDHVNGGIDIRGDSDIRGHAIVGNFISIETGNNTAIRFIPTHTTTIPSSISANVIKSYVGGGRTGISIGTDQPYTTIVNNSISGMNTYDIEVLATDCVINSNICSSICSNSLNIRGSGNSFGGNVTKSSVGATGQHFFEIGTRKIYPVLAIPDFAGELGDRAWQIHPSVGTPKGWICTAVGVSWISEGNL